jgi:isopentenyldiphosphate isomerase
MVEQFDIYTKDGTRHLGVKDRADVHRDGDWHRSVHVWIVRPTDRALLVQQRAPGKDTWPGYYDASVGGHLSAGEGYEDAYREVEEELGVTIDLNRLVPLGVEAIELIPPDQPDITDRELCLVALALDDRPLEAYPFNPVELTAIASLPLTGLRALMSGRATTITRWDGAQTARSELKPEELIPQPYLPALSDAAQGLVDRAEEPPKTAIKAP